LHGGCNFAKNKYNKPILDYMAQYFTKEGLKKLKEELHDLKTKEVKRVTKLIAEAAAFGDLKENAAYHEARNMKSFLLGRIEQLEGAVNDAVIKEKVGSGKVQLGSEVVIMLDGAKEEYKVVAPAEADILKNKISYQSPLGQQLMNREAGKEFNYEINGQKVKVKVVSIA
jgi:transcription elongation factor GreA